MSRIAIAGGPEAGKSTLARLLAIEPVRGTDGLIDSVGWDAAASTIAEWMAQPGPWVIEGALTARGLRQRMRDSRAKPADLVVWVSGSFDGLSPGQQRLQTQVNNLMGELVPRLRARGVAVRTVALSELQDNAEGVARSIVSGVR